MLGGVGARAWWSALVRQVDLADDAEADRGAVGVPPLALGDLGVGREPGSGARRLAGGAAQVGGVAQIRAAAHDALVALLGTARVVDGLASRVARVGVGRVAVRAQLRHVAEHVHQAEGIGLHLTRRLGAALAVARVDRVLGRGPRCARRTGGSTGRAR